MVSRHRLKATRHERMLDLYRRLAGTRIEPERTVIEARISATDPQIESFVQVQMDEEIAIVDDGIGARNTQEVDVHAR